MWQQIHAPDVFYLAAFTTVVTFVTDFMSRRREKRRRASREPAEVESIVLANATMAMELQSGVFESLKRELEARDAVLRDRTAELAAKDVELKAATQREAALLRRIGELTMENEMLRSRSATGGA